MSKKVPLDAPKIEFDGHGFKAVFDEDKVEKLRQEAIAYEKKQDNSNDIYKVAARIKNLARQDGKAALTPAGEALCNLFVHTIMAYYQFAETLDPETKERLNSLTREQEGMPGKLIAAMAPRKK